MILASERNSQLNRANGTEIASDLHTQDLFKLSHLSVF